MNCIDEDAPPSMANLKLFATMDLTNEDMMIAEEKFEIGSGESSTSALAQLTSDPSSSYMDQGSPSNSLSKKAFIGHTPLKNVFSDDK
jgi:hypothetical protein